MTWFQRWFGPTPPTPPPPPPPLPEPPDHPDDDQRRAAQLAAIDAIAEMELTPEYDQEATASRQTTPATHTTPRQRALNRRAHTHKETPMTALNNRQMSLKLAVENYAFAGDNTGEDYYLVDSQGEIDDTVLDGVLALADRFAAYLGADDRTPTVPSGDSAPADDTESTIEAIRNLLQRSREDIGGRATTAALDQLDQLRTATRGQGKDAIIRTAISFVDGTGRSEFGNPVADRLITGLRSL